jgi:putative FmdB family regulatory protein
MPVYEYYCQDSAKRFSVRLSYSEYGNITIQCIACHSQKVQRRIERNRIGHSEEERLQQIADPAQMEALDDDPVALGGMLRKMEDQMGEEIAPEFDEVVGRLEKGQTPEEIEKEIPEIGALDSGYSDESNYSDDF